MQALKTELAEELKNAIINGDEELSEKAAAAIVKAGIDPLEALNVVTNTARDVGDMFAKGEIFLTQLMMLGSAMKAAIRVLTENIPPGTYQKMGKVVLGTVAGDIHDLGKTVVGCLLVSNNFEVYDIGIDVPSARFAEEAQKVKADVVAMSALMTTSMPAIKDTIDYFNALGIRQKYKIIVGGAPITADYAKQVGADGYAEDAPRGVELVRRLVTKTV